MSDDPPPTAEAVVVLYWRPGCQFCWSLRKRLAAADVQVDERNIWDDDRHAAAVRQATGGSETVPTVVVGGSTLVNPSSRQVLTELGVPEPLGPVARWRARRAAR